MCGLTAVSRSLLGSSTSALWRSLPWNRAARPTVHGGCMVSGRDTLKGTDAATFARLTCSYEPTLSTAHALLHQANQMRVAGELTARARELTGTPKQVRELLSGEFGEILRAAAF